MTEDCIRGPWGRRRAPAARRRNIGGAGANLGDPPPTIKEPLFPTLTQYRRPSNFTLPDLVDIVFIGYVAILTGLQQEVFPFSVPSVGILECSLVVLASADNHVFLGDPLDIFHSLTVQRFHGVLP